MNRVLLIRHTATASAGRLCGYSDPDLNAEGEAQLLGVVERLQDVEIGRICSSDLRRAIRVAEAIARPRGLTVQARSALREIGFGAWEDMEWNQVQTQFPHEAERWLSEFPREAAPGGESHSAFESRVMLVFLEILRDSADKTIAVVTHRGVMQCILRNVFAFTEQEAWRHTADYGSILTLTAASELSPRFEEKPT